MMTTKISDLTADFLQEKGIRHVFGIIGAGNAHLFDSISQKGYTEIICVHHEQAACMAMQTYYRTCGVISAAIVTTGAGSTNTITGVVSAWMDSIPGLIISGNENSKFTLNENPLRIWGVQGYDCVAMVSKVTKYANRVLDPKAVLAELEAAYYHAMHGRPGPCWIDIPMNIQAASVNPDEIIQFKKPEETNKIVSSQSLIKNSKQGASEVLPLLHSAERPVIWLGHGIRLGNAVDLIEPLINTLQCPVLVSWAGIDMIPSEHPLVFGRAGIYGQRAANFVLQNCDFLLTIGTRLAIPQIGYNLSEFARCARIAVVDIDLQELTKHGARVNVPILANAKEFLSDMINLLQTTDYSSENKLPWLEKCKTYQKKYPVVDAEHADRDGFINSYPFMLRLSHYFKPNQIIVTDMGTALLSGHQVLPLKKNQRLMTSTGLGEMGYGLPGAIGASFATNKGEIICLNCDGGMMLNLQELQTMVHHRLPIKLFIFNNDGYLMIKHTQKALFSGRYTGTDNQSGISCPNFSALGHAFGVPACSIKTWLEFEKVIPKVMAHQGPIICEVFTHPEQLFVPKLSLALQKDGSIISPPLEDLSPLIPREELRENMIT
ncbi:MAG: putative thiamine pyrophosphate enzyme [uncultured bacterium]|nr:MAG: putative thiamine pyrophosphate enzyme [uncultured bacterium]